MGLVTPTATTVRRLPLDPALPFPVAIVAAIDQARTYGALGLIRVTLSPRDAQAWVGYQVEQDVDAPQRGIALADGTICWIAYGPASWIEWWDA
ncbi:MAG: hypothetical protein K6V97_03995 [Actinomycetia bacterium]|nr:hypothetical protein [Actinomycetes bacterium]